LKLREPELLEVVAGAEDVEEAGVELLAGVVGVEEPVAEAAPLSVIDLLIVRGGADSVIVTPADKQASSAIVFAVAKSAASQTDSKHSATAVTQVVSWHKQVVS